MIRRHIRLLRLGLMAADAASAFLLFGLILVLRFELVEPTAEWRAGAGRSWFWQWPLDSSPAQ